MREFEQYRLGAEDEDGRYLPADEGLFTRVVDGAVNWQSRIDQATDRGLVAKWPIDRIDPVLWTLSRDFVGDTAETASLLWPQPLTPAGRPPTEAAVPTPAWSGRCPRPPASTCTCSSTASRSN